MVSAGNLLTHYQYRLCQAELDERPGEVEWNIRTPRQQADLRVIVRIADALAVLPAGSPFLNLKKARRFAFPLPYTFNYEPETHSIIRVQGVRREWHPKPVRGQGSSKHLPAQGALLPRHADPGNCIRSARCSLSMEARDTHSSGVEMTGKIPARGSYQGLLQIFRYNRPFYIRTDLTAIAAIILSLWLPLALRTLLLFATGAAVFWTCSSLLVSHYV